MTTSVLTTKLFAPVRRPHILARPRLTRQLDTTLDAGQRLTLVSAPAGFGKTTALCDWLIHLAERKPLTRVGWLQLDEGDNDLARLMTHLVASLNSVGLGVHADVVEFIQGASISNALTALVNSIARTPETTLGDSWVLVLDDYHVITASEVHEAVGFLVEHLSDHVRLVMATRSDPPLPLARLRSGGQLTEVRASELRFTGCESSEFLNTSMGLDLTAADVDALEERTEGWVVGLQLAALSLRGIAEPSDIARFIESFTGSNRFVIDYLTDEVLARQPVQVREFLLATAVLDRLTGGLCNALTGRADGANMLEQLERGNLFVAPLDSERSWYRYHHLFGDVLHARLRAEAPNQVRRLHQRASDWFAAAGMIEDAVRHSIAAEDFERAGRLVEESLPKLRRTRQDGLLLGWLRSLPAAVVRRSPVLSILSGWSSMLSGDLDEVGHRLDEAEAALRAGAEDQRLADTWADTDDLRTAWATISVYRASLAQARGDVSGTVDHARRALELAATEDHFVNGAACAFLGLASWAAGDVRDGLTTFAAALGSLHAAGNLVDELDGTVVLVDMWVASGRPRRARRLCEQALARAIDGGGRYVRATADLHVALAELDIEADDLISAAEHLQTARVLAERTSITENRHRWFVAMSQVRATAGDYDTAMDLLDRAEALYRHGFYPDVRPMAAMKARVQIASGDLLSAAAWATDQAVDVGDSPEFLREYEHLTLARLLLAQHRIDRPRRSGAVPLAGLVALLDRLHAAAIEAGRDGSTVEIRVLQSLAHHARGDLPAAFAALGRAMIGSPEPDGYVRLYLDERAPMMALLYQAASGNDRHPGAECGGALRVRARRLLERAQSTPGSEPSRPGAEALSQREIEVLRLLDSELTGPEIALEMYVTLNTLRTHTKRIFIKLDVKTRATAVQRARQRGLL